MPATPHPLELDPAALNAHCDPAQFDFATTAELPNLRAIIGQPRGVRAIEFGIDIDNAGYNVFVMGPRGTGRLTTIERFIQARAADDPAPDDWVYVHNFAAPYQPHALRLPPGMGRQLAADMNGLVTRLQAELNRAFDAEEFQETAQQIERDYQAKGDALLTQVQTMAAQQGFVLRNTQSGLALIPLKPDGQPMNNEDYDALRPEDRATLEARRAVLADELADSLRETAELEQLAQEAYAHLQRDTAAALLDSQLEPLRTQYADFAAVLTYFDALRADALDHLASFSPANPQPNAQGGMPTPPDGAGPDGLARYAVNVLVDHADAEGAPVVVVALPTYQNLVGRIEHRVEFGALTTDFTMIKPGALHQANGGFLVIRAADILQQPFAWEALKRALIAEQVCIEEPESRGTSVITTQTLEPAPIPLHVKVIMLGNPALYYTLFEQEEDFPELFKIKADFAATMERDAESEAQYANFIATRCHEENLPHFTAAAVARMIEYGAQLADDQHHLSTRFGEITDLVREAAYYARQADRDTTAAEDVIRAIEERRFRSNLYEELSHRQILDDFVIIDTDGASVGQINGLTVMQLGDHSFGQPSRITARVYMGQSDVVQIEREVRLTGPIHDKGLLTLRGYVGSMYGRDFPLALGASLTFEQNYGGVEGDSASSAELYALLSALSGYPIRQDLAVTGSVDQRGVVQAIGGVTEKIEGFFQICQERGLTGTQGVVIPKANVRNLMLNAEVIQAVREGQFHIYAIGFIDEGIELLMGHPAGQRGPDEAYTAGSVHRAVEDRLRALAEGLRQYNAPIVRLANEDH